MEKSVDQAAHNEPIQPYSSLPPATQLLATEGAIPAFLTVTQSPLLLQPIQQAPIAEIHTGTTPLTTQSHLPLPPAQQAATTEISE